MQEPLWPPNFLDVTDRFIDHNQPDWHLNACVGSQLPGPWDSATHYYSDGFRAAAFHCINSIVGGKAFHFPVDIAVYPIIFLYRHHLELVLKLLIVAAQSHLGEPRQLPTGHRLNALWKKARGLIEQCEFEWKTDWSQNCFVTQLLEELSNLDPNGEAGRYAFSMDGKKHFGDLKILNVRHFAVIAEKLSEYLRAILSGIAITDDLRREWELEMMRYDDSLA